MKAVSPGGGSRFLAASMQMPLTAVALVMEFTHMDHSYLAPTLLCAAGAFLTCRVLDKKRLMSCMKVNRRGPSSWK
jgi:H+/Cl- antiporter ClcA